MNEPPHQHRRRDLVSEYKNQGAIIESTEPEQNRVIGQSGDSALTTENPHPISSCSSASGQAPAGEIRVGQPAEDAVIGRPGDLAIEKQNQKAPASVATCTWRRGNGAMCGRPADGGRDECWLHAEWYSLLPAVWGLPYPEDAVAIHQILARTRSMVIGEEISPQKAQAITKLCRELRRNLMWYQREMGMW